VRADDDDDGMLLDGGNDLGLVTCDRQLRPLLFEGEARALPESLPERFFGERLLPRGHSARGTLLMTLPHLGHSV
jgi:hypothetical protein